MSGLKDEILNVINWQTWAYEKVRRICTCPEFSEFNGNRKKYAKFLKKHKILNLPNYQAIEHTYYFSTDEAAMFRVMMLLEFAKENGVEI